MSAGTFRLALVLACVIGLSPLVFPAPPPTETPAEEIQGNVVPLADLAARAGTKLDADAAPSSLVLVTEQGKAYFLLKDGGSRMFFKDPALLRRPMRLTGRFLPGSQILRVLAVRSVHKGELHEVYYWCDICSIRRSEKDICECCGGPMTLREEPLKK